VFLASGALIKFDVSPFIDEGLRRESNQRKSLPELISKACARLTQQAARST